LLSISFADKYKAKQIKSLDGSSASIIRPSIGGLFGFGQQDDEPKKTFITIRHPTQTNIINVERKAFMKADDYIALVVLMLSIRPPDTIPISQLELDYADKLPFPKTKLTIYNPEYTLQFDSKLADFLGFEDKVEFGSGTFLSENNIKGSEIDTIPLQTSNLAIRNQEKKVEFTAPEFDPEDLQDYYDQIVEKAVVALESANAKVSLSISPGDNVLSVVFNENTEKIRFGFPAEVNKHLGLPEDYEFVKDTDIKLPLNHESAIKPKELTKSELERETILKEVVANQVLVSTNITESIRIGPNFRPVVRSIPRGSKDSIVQSFDFPNVQYHRVLPKELQSISISLTDPGFKPIKEELYPTTALLIFVKARL
jgi:hypothetical protein